MIISAHAPSSACWQFRMRMESGAAGDSHKGSDDRDRLNENGSGIHPWQTLSNIALKGRTNCSTVVESTFRRRIVVLVIPMAIAADGLLSLEVVFCSSSLAFFAGRVLKMKGDQFFGVQKRHAIIGRSGGLQYLERCRHYRP